jgi:hypothetical protein
MESKHVLISSHPPTSIASSSIEKVLDEKKELCVKKNSILPTSQEREKICSMNEQNWA